MRDGLDGSVKRPGLYYPYWAMVQTLLAGKEETVDLLSSRKLLAGFTAEEADEEVQTYINLLQAIAHEASNANKILRKNILIRRRWFYRCFLQGMSVNVQKRCWIKL